MLFNTTELFSPRFACHFTTKIHQRYTWQLILIQGAKLKLPREQGDTKFDLGSIKNSFGEHQKNYSGSWEKRAQFQRELGAGDLPFQRLVNGGESQNHALNRK